MGNVATTGSGGAIYQAASSRLTLPTATNITDNAATLGQGGGLFLTTSASASLGAQAYWVNNSAGSSGNALAAFDSSNVTFGSDPILQANAGPGTAAVLISGARLTMGRVSGVFNMYPYT